MLYLAPWWIRKSATLVSLTFICAVMLEFRYARCTCSVSYAIPTYYAHLLAFRARFYMADEPQLNGSYVPMHNAAENSVKQLLQLCERLKNRQIYSQAIQLRFLLLLDIEINLFSENFYICPSD